MHCVWCLSEVLKKFAETRSCHTFSHTQWHNRDTSIVGLFSYFKVSSSSSFSFQFIFGNKQKNYFPSRCINSKHEIATKWARKQQERSSIARMVSVMHFLHFLQGYEFLYANFIRYKSWFFSHRKICTQHKISSVLPINVRECL